MYWASTSNNEENNGQEKVNDEEVINQMNQTWKKKIDKGKSENDEVVITQSNELCDSC